MVAVRRPSGVQSGPDFIYSQVTGKPVALDMDGHRQETFTYRPIRSVAG